jgi:hypothetical protein
MLVPSSSSFLVVYAFVWKADSNQLEQEKKFEHLRRFWALAELEFGIFCNLQIAVAIAMEGKRI